MGTIAKTSGKHCCGPKARMKADDTFQVERGLKSQRI